MKNREYETLVYILNKLQTSSASGFDAQNLADAIKYIENKCKALEKGTKGTCLQIKSKK